MRVKEFLFLLEVWKRESQITWPLRALLLLNILNGGSDSEQSSCSTGGLGLISGWEDPLEEGMATTPVSLPGESHGQSSLVGYSPWGRKESDTTEAT